MEKGKEAEKGVKERVRGRVESGKDEIRSRGIGEEREESGWNGRRKRKEYKGRGGRNGDQGGRGERRGGGKERGR